MPVKKSSKSRPKSVVHHGLYVNEFMKRILGVLLIIAMVYFIVFLGTLIRNNIEKFRVIGVADRAERTITIDGDAFVTALPDVARVSMGVTSEGESVEDAQNKNTSVMNRLIGSLQSLGISKEDIQTANYNVFPRYRYTEEEGQIIDGYQVSQQVSVKIRQLDRANEVIGLAGKLGITNVSGLQFSLDDRDVYVAEARDKALLDVKQKAQALADSLGVDIVGIVSYNEYEAGGKGIMPFRAYAEFDSGFGGAPAPEIAEGTTDVHMNVSVTFEIR